MFINKMKFKAHVHVSRHGKPSPGVINMICRLRCTRKNRFPSLDDDVNSARGVKSVVKKRNDAI